MNEIKYIFCDIDGTLLNKGDRIQSEFIQFVSQLNSRGIYFTFASGRLPYMIQPLLDELNLGNHYFVSCNGALVKNKERILFSKKFPLLKVKKIIDQALNYNMTVLYAIDEEEFLLQENSATIRKRKERGHYHPLRAILENEYQALEILKMNILTDDSDKTIDILAAELNELSKELHITRYGNHGIEIVTQNVDKLTGIQNILSHIDGDLSETCTIGDNENDKKMIQAAKIGVAVGNATSEIKETADFVTNSDSAQGVLEALKHIFDLERGNSIETIDINEYTF